MHYSRWNLEAVAHTEKAGPSSFDLIQIFKFLEKKRVKIKQDGLITFSQKMS